MDHDWEQDVGVFTATELEDWAHLASVGHLTQRSAEILAVNWTLVMELTKSNGGYETTFSITLHQRSDFTKFLITKLHFQV